MADRPKIRVIAAAIVRDARVLLVRKSSGPTFILPGGKPEPGESEPETLRREIHEELGCDIDNLERFGQFLDVAADQADHAVSITVYLGTLIGTPFASAEIAELRWRPLTVTDGLAPVHTQINPALETHFAAPNALPRHQR